MLAVHKVHNPVIFFCTSAKIEIIPVIAVSQTTVVLLISMLAAANRRSSKSEEVNIIGIDKLK